MPNGSRVSVTVRVARSWMAIAYMPRSARRRSRAPSRSQRCSGGSQSLPVAKRVSGMPGAQLAVVVDLAVGDQRGRAGEERLVAAGEVDDREPRVHQRDAPDHGVAGAVRPAMRQRARQRREQRRGSGGRRVGGQRRGRRCRTSGLLHVVQEVAPARQRPAPRRIPLRSARARRRRAGRRARGPRAPAPIASASAAASSERHQQAVLVRARSARAGPSARAATTGRPRRPGLDHHVAQRLVPRRADEQVGRRPAMRRCRCASRAGARRSATPSRRASALQRGPLRPFAGDHRVHAGQAAAGRGSARRTPCCGAAGPAPAPAGARRQAERRAVAAPARSGAKFGRWCDPRGSASPAAAIQATSRACCRSGGRSAGSSRGRNSRRAARRAPSRRAGVKRAARFIQATATRGREAAQHAPPSRGRVSRSSAPPKPSWTGASPPARSRSARAGVAPDDRQHLLAGPVPARRRAARRTARRRPSAAPAMTCATFTQSPCRPAPAPAARLRP